MKDGQDAQPNYKTLCEDFVTVYRALLKGLRYNDDNLARNYLLKQIINAKDQGETAEDIYQKIIVAYVNTHDNSSAAFVLSSLNDYYKSSSKNTLYQNIYQESLRLTWFGKSNVLSTKNLELHGFEHDYSSTKTRRNKIAQELSFINTQQDNNNTDIKRLVFSGGGAKGSLYGGVYKALHDLNVMPSVAEISGASAGAIIAALAAVNASSETIDEIANYDLNELLGQAVKNSQAPGVVKIPGLIATKDGAALLAMLQDKIKASIQNNIRDIIHSNLISAEPDKTTLNALLKKTSDFTFADLNTLHQICPAKFKNLSVVTIKYPDGKQQVFNHELTPEVSLALACRASASIPVVLEPVKIDINGNNAFFMDGGYFDNVPTEIFDKSLEGAFNTNNKRNQTITFAFERSYTISYKEWLVRDVITKILSGLKATYRNTERKVATFLRLNKLYKENTIELYHPHNITSRNFARANANKKIMDYLGYISVMEQILEHNFHKNKLNLTAFYDNITTDFEAKYCPHYHKEHQFIRKFKALSSPKEKFIFIRNHINQHLKDTKVSATFIASIDVFKNGLKKDEVLETESQRIQDLRKT
jgi:predicted acylesterase/phospholipase RssA